MVSLLVQNYATNILVCCDNPTDALNLYETAISWPGSKTKEALLKNGLILHEHVGYFCSSVWKVLKESIPMILKFDKSGSEIAAY